MISGMKKANMKLPMYVFPVALVVKSLSANAGDIRDTDLIPGSGRSPGEGNGNAF